jgi:mannonate dehydratase
MSLLQSWRWYGPNDPVTLQDVKQAGATGIVSALHHMAHGAVWPVEEIQERKKVIEDAGLQWAVVESVPVHEAIKTRSADCDKYLDNYRQTLRNLAACGLTTVCYNFMPVLDWTRTNLAYELPNGAKALLFDWVNLAVFDLYILKREGAEKDYASAIVEQAQERYKSFSEYDLKMLSDIILMGVPTEGSVTIEELSKSIDIYKSIGHEGLRKNLTYFLESIMDVCEETDIKMTIHPDDPPYPILGLPRIASSKEDLLYIIEKVDREPNGICFCTGSLGAGGHNNPVEILKVVGHRVYFAHLRNVLKNESGSFYESDHLAGDVDMYSVMKELVAINKQREQSIPFRPDHGHQMLDDLHKVTNPGYSAIGRLRGLAELRGLEMGIEKSLY